MADASDRAHNFRVPTRPPAVDQLRDRIRGPEDIDRATRELSLDPRLLNLHLATVIDLTGLGLGRALHIPVQISNREGGRKSLYYLDVGEEVLAGVFVHELGMILRYVKRTSGKAGRAETGDTYTERLARLDGQTLSEVTGSLDVVDADRGHGHFKIAGAGQLRATPRREWYLWSFVYFWEVPE